MLHWQNCATEPTVGFQGSLLPGQQCFCISKIFRVDEKQTNLHKRHSLIREVVCHIPLSRTLHIPTGESFAPYCYFYPNFLRGRYECVFLCKSFKKMRQHLPLAVCSVCKSRRIGHVLGIRISEKVKVKLDHVIRINMSEKMTLEILQL